MLVTTLVLILIVFTIFVGLNKLKYILLKSSNTFEASLKSKTMQAATNGTGG